MTHSSRNHLGLHLSCNLILQKFQHGESFLFYRKYPSYLSCLFSGISVANLYRSWRLLEQQHDSRRSHLPGKTRSEMLSNMYMYRNINRYIDRWIRFILNFTTEIKKKVAAELEPYWFTGKGGLFDREFTNSLIIRDFDDVLKNPFRYVHLFLINTL